MRGGGRTRRRGPDIKKLLLNKGRNVCHYCRRSVAVEDITIDHMTPLCRGGKNLVKNTVLACRDCNKLKGPLTAEEFLRTRTNDNERKALVMKQMRILQARQS